jgi:cytochrome P450
MSAPSEVPGRLGLPFWGETSAFLANPFKYLNDRKRWYGPTFKSRLLGRNIVFLSGTSGAEAFYDSTNISRSDAHPFHLVSLFGGINMEMYDGPRHFALKSMALTAFDESAIAEYIPDMESTIRSTLSRLAQRPEFAAAAEFRKLAISVLCRNVLGLEPGPEIDSIADDYGRVLRGLVSVPLPLPGMPYRAATAARNRVLARIREVIRERRRQPASDAVSRMLGAKAADARVFTDEEAMLEVHHVVIAGFIVYALMGELLLQLDLQPALRERCAAEVLDNYAGPLTLAMLRNLRTCACAVLESKRYVPIVPMAFGRAQRAFEHEGLLVSKNWTVYLALYLVNQDPEIWTNPEQFDPDRFAPPRSEQRRHPMAFIPQGAEPPTGHRCLGLDYATYLALTFLAVLLRDFDWKLPPQSLERDWKRLPPDPRDGLRVALVERTPP